MTHNSTDGGKKCAKCKNTGYYQYSTHGTPHSKVCEFCCKHEGTPWKAGEKFWCKSGCGMEMPAPTTSPEEEKKPPVSQEFQKALKLADWVLDQPHCDPDGDIEILARQFLRSVEREKAAIPSTPKDNKPQTAPWPHGIEMAEPKLVTTTNKECCSKCWNSKYAINRNSKKRPSHCGLSCECHSPENNCCDECLSYMNNDGEAFCRQNSCPCHTQTVPDKETESGIRKAQTNDTMLESNDEPRSSDNLNLLKHTDKCCRSHGIHDGCEGDSIAKPSESQSGTYYVDSMTPEERRKQNQILLTAIHTSTNDTPTNNEWEEEFNRNLPPNGVDWREKTESEVYQFGYKVLRGNEIFTVVDWGNIKKFISTLLTAEREKERDLWRVQVGDLNDLWSRGEIKGRTQTLSKIKEMIKVMKIGLGTAADMENMNPSDAEIAYIKGHDDALTDIFNKLEI